MTNGLVTRGLNYKAGTAGAELPYKAAIAFDDPRLGRPLASARPQFADVRQAVAQKGWWVDSVVKPLFSQSKG